MNNFTRGMKKHLQKMLRWRISARISFFVLGISSTVWFLIRIIPKPSRAGYPCMRAAAPLMSAFILYLLSISSSLFAFRKFKRHLLDARYMAAAGFLVVALIGFFVSGSINNIQSHAVQLVDESSFTANDPIGIARGIHPGRVVWVWDRFATDSTCTNTSGDYWFQNTDAAQVNSMLAHGLTDLTGELTPSDAWDAIFRYFNSNHGKGDVGYVSGEKIVIKLNFTTLGNGGRHLNDQMDATPQLVMSLLTELIDSLSIAQSDITIGDPYRGMPDEVYNPCHTKYPNVHYIEGLGTDGREQTVISADDEFFNSDDNFTSRLPQAYLDAAYLINMPCLKSHNSAGITITAKNHQGSVIGPDQDATSQYMGPYLHYDYPVDGGSENQVMGIYRHIVDFMAHAKLGGNTLIYIVDALWSGRNWDGVVEKWQMPPFNNDWTSSLFISQDPVAIESVGFDFLYNEYNDYPSSHGNANYPLVNGVQDYIHQAADPANWPSGISYDPNTADHSSPVGSLGVHEHWNNSSDKQYTRNLGNGDGIELISDTLGVTETPPNAFSSLVLADKLSLKNFPKPATDQVFFEYTLSAPGHVLVEVFQLNGNKLAELKNEEEFTGSHQSTWNVSGLSAGLYFFRIQIQTPEGFVTATKKFLVE